MLAAEIFEKTHSDERRKNSLPNESVRNADSEFNVSPSVSPRTVGLDTDVSSIGVIIDEVSHSPGGEIQSLSKCSSEHPSSHSFPKNQSEGSNDRPHTNNTTAQSKDKKYECRITSPLSKVQVELNDICENEARENEYLKTTIYQLELEISSLKASLAKINRTSEKGEKQSLLDKDHHNPSSSDMQKAPFRGVAKANQDEEALHPETVMEINSNSMKNDGRDPETRSGSLKLDTDGMMHTEEVSKIHTFDTSLQYNRYKIESSGISEVTDQFEPSIVFTPFVPSPKSYQPQHPETDHSDCITQKNNTLHRQSIAKKDFNHSTEIPKNAAFTDLLEKLEVSKKRLKETDHKLSELMKEEELVGLSLRGRRQTDDSARSDLRSTHLKNEATM